MIGSLTIFTSTKPAQLGKVYSLKNGLLDKTVAGNMAEGSYEVSTFDSRESLAALLTSIGTNQAISTSRPRTGETTGRIVTADKAAALACLARTKADFQLFTGPAILTLDYDPPSNDLPVLSCEELWETLCQMFPAAKTAGAVWWCSGSSHIHSPNGEIQGLKGQRLYLLIQDAADIPRAGQALADRCWLKGLGRVHVSISGQRLLRSLWDEAMHEPARLDFIGGAICEPPLFQQRGSPVLLGGDGWLDTRTAMPDLTTSERASLEVLQRDAKDKAQTLSHERHESWSSDRAKELAKVLQSEKGLPIEEAMAQGGRIVESALSGTLYGDYRIPLANGKFITVAEVLDQRQKWDKKKTLDPLEPEHRNFEECGILYLSGTEQRLFTFAHGGMTFRLSRQPLRVENRRGQQSAVADIFARTLAAQGDIFRSGESDLVQALPGKFETLEKTDLQYLLGHRLALVTIKDGKDVPSNIPIDLVAMTYSAMGQKPDQTPPTLSSITSLPYATSNRRLVTVPGFDVETGIFNLMLTEVELPAGSSSSETCIKALRCLWEPWANYKWASDADRAGMLAAIFTAVLRPAMETAPGVFFDAPVQASGKTKAALALGALMTGSSVGVYTFVDGKNQEEEYSKAIISMLRSERRFWLIDNVTGRFESPVLAGLITSGRVQGRILGVSKEGNFSARVMLCATGNNATLGNDLNRRFLCCRIDTGVERPSDVPHRFEPAHVAEKNRLEIATAVLSILKTYWQSPSVTVTGGADFHEWTKLVREPIVWLQQQGLTEAAGIGSVTDPAMALGVESAVVNFEKLGLQQFLEGIEKQVGCYKPFQAKELLDWYVAGEDRCNETEALIRDGIDNLTGGKNQTTLTLGKFLLYRRDRRESGLRLARVEKDRAGVLWQVRRD